MLENVVNHYRPRERKRRGPYAFTMHATVRTEELMVVYHSECFLSANVSPGFLIDGGSFLLREMHACGWFSRIRGGGMYALNIVCDTKHRNTT